jgi:hypothetical protein
VVSGFGINSTAGITAGAMTQPSSKSAADKNPGG